MQSILFAAVDEHTCNFVIMYPYSSFTRVLVKVGLVALGFPCQHVDVICKLILGYRFSVLCLDINAAS